MDMYSTYIHTYISRERERSKSGSQLYYVNVKLFFLHIIIIINRVWELVTDFYQFLEWGT